MTDARLLSGRYEIGSVLGYGGMAEVHHGRDHRLGRDVAIKVLRSDLARDPGFQARFRREAQNAAALNHPAIVSVYDTGEDDEQSAYPVPFIVMEYVEGQTLKDVLTAEARLMPERALEIVADVCAALDFSHRHGIIHRDIKPGNVMLTSQGAVKVMDFGIARAITSASSQMTATSAVIGTAQYLSPEQARGETVDARSDVYSTGCLLYELLVGEPPFTGDNPVSVAYQHVREDPVPPSERNPMINPAIDAIVLKAMAKNPVNRYQSAGEMRADLLRAAAGRPVAATPVLPSNERTAVLGGGVGGRPPMGGGYPTQTVPPEPTGKKNPGKIAVAVLAAVALFAVIGFAVAQLTGGSGEEVEVPDVLGKSEELAVSALKKEGFQAEISRAASKPEEKDTVVDQSPKGGETADPETTKVKIVIGLGEEQVTVPANLVGSDKEGAVERLKLAGLRAKVEEVDSDRPEDQVVDVSPPSGTKVAANSEVTLKVSRGNRALVPDVVGLTQEDAEDKLRGAGFKVSVTSGTGGGAPGTVISQSPRQGTRQDPGTTVTIVVARGAEVSEPPVPTDEPDETPTESPSPTPDETGGLPTLPGGGGEDRDR